MAALLIEPLVWTGGTARSYRPKCRGSTSLHCRMIQLGRMIQLASQTPWLGLGFLLLKEQTDVGSASFPHPERNQTLVGQH
jgi:hypothetical protein